MALPKLNVLPKFELTIPSTGKKMFFRPYLVKEEKLMLLAFESKDVDNIVAVMVDTIAACAEEELNVKTLTTFDVEYLFTKIRAKSVGEVIKFHIPCDNIVLGDDGEEKTCGHVNEVRINVDEITIDKPQTDNIIKLTDTISIELKYPAFKDVLTHDVIDTADMSADTMFRLVTKCIGAILTPEERFDAKDSTDKEIAEFLDSLTSEQFGKIAEFLNNMPKMKTHVQYTCGKCGQEHDMTFEGMTDFF